MKDEKTTHSNVQSVLRGCWVFFITLNCFEVLSQKLCESELKMKTILYLLTAGDVKNKENYLAQQNIQRWF